MPFLSTTGGGSVRGFRTGKKYNIQGAIGFWAGVSQTWTVPTGVNRIAVAAIGGGGGGHIGGDGSNTGYNHGGGGGGAVYCNSIAVTPGQVINISVGSGGASGGNPGSPGNGGNTTVSSGSWSLTATGGQGAQTNGGGNGGSYSSSNLSGVVGYNGGFGARGDGGDDSGGGGGAGGWTSSGTGGWQGSPSSRVQSQTDSTDRGASGQGGNAGNIVSGGSGAIGGLGDGDGQDQFSAGGGGGSYPNGTLGLVGEQGSGRYSGHRGNGGTWGGGGSGQSSPKSSTSSTGGTGASGIVRIVYGSNITGTMPNQFTFTSSSSKVYTKPSLIPQSSPSGIYQINYNGAEAELFVDTQPGAPSIDGNRSARGWMKITRSWVQNNRASLVRRRNVADWDGTAWYRNDVDGQIGTWALMLPSWTVGIKITKWLIYMDNGPDWYQSSSWSAANASTRWDSLYNTINLGSNVSSYSVDVGQSGGRMVQLITNSNGISNEFSGLYEFAPTMPAIENMSGTLNAGLPNESGQNNSSTSENNHKWLIWTSSDGASENYSLRDFDIWVYG